jgi:hypothetical protein
MSRGRQALGRSGQLHLGADLELFGACFRPKTSENGGRGDGDKLALQDLDEMSAEEIEASHGGSGSAPASAASEQARYCAGPSDRPLSSHPQRGG